MVFIFRLLEFIVKIVLLIILVSFERVIGFPVLFFTVSISMMLLSKPLSRYLIFIIAAFLLAIFYQMAFIVSFILLTFFYVVFIIGDQFVESNLKRFLILLSICTLFIYFSTDFEFNLLVLIQLLVSFIVSSIYLMKFLFVRYGFIGAKNVVRKSFFK